MYLTFFLILLTPAIVKATFTTKPLFHRQISSILNKSMSSFSGNPSEFKRVIQVIINIILCKG